MIDADTGAAADLDRARLAGLEPDQTDLIIRPGKNLQEGHRYIVALRNLKDAGGGTIPAPRASGCTATASTPAPPVEQRRQHFEGIFATLRRAGVARDDLYLAWDFTVASEQNITERMLSIRDDAFAQLGDHGPHRRPGAGPGALLPGHRRENLTPSDPHGTQNVREVTGTFEVPCST